MVEKKWIIRVFNFNKPQNLLPPACMYYISILHRKDKQLDDCLKAQDKAFQVHKEMGNSVLKS